MREDKSKAGREGGESSGGIFKVLLRADATATTTMHSSPRQPASRGDASVRDRIDRAKGIAVRQAIQLKIYTTRSLKRDETAEYIRFLHATAEGDPDTVMCNAEGDGLESDRSPMDSDTYVGNPVDDFLDRDR